MATYETKEQKKGFIARSLRFDQNYYIVTGVLGGVVALGYMAYSEYTAGKDIGRMIAYEAAKKKAEKEEPTVQDKTQE